MGMVRISQSMLVERKREPGVDAVKSVGVMCSICCSMIVNKHILRVILNKHIECGTSLLLHSTARQLRRCSKTGAPSPCLVVSVLTCGSFAQYLFDHLGDVCTVWHRPLALGSV